MLGADLTQEYNNLPRLRKDVHSICMLYKKIASTVQTSLSNFIAKKKKTHFNSQIF